MARMTVDGTELDNPVLDKLGDQLRPMIKRIVMAGSAAAEKRMQENIRQRNHIRNGDMLEAVGNNGYREFYRSGATDVYPQGNDRFGVRNADKAYIINYGRGGVRKKGAKLGDKFITGDERNAEELVFEAMQAENDRIIDEITKE